MKQILVTLAAICPLLLSAAPVAPRQLGSREAKQKVMLQAPNKSEVDDLFACPENTVLDGPFIEEQVGYQGFQSSDQGRPEMPTKFYQHFHGCVKTVNAVRFIGVWNFFDEESYNWLGCFDRAGIDMESYACSNPVKFEISFYKEDEDGMPGECIYKQESDLIGRYIGIVYGYEPDVQPIYEFKVDLNEDIKLETGYVSFSAVDMGDTPTCWFSVYTADSSHDYGYTSTGEYGLIGSMPCIFSLMGDGDFAAQKALGVESIVAPAANANGTHEKVTAKVSNAGAEDLNDATLELWADDNFIGSETIKSVIPSQSQFTYTFVQRVNLSGKGEHKIEVRNATPGDEKIAKQSAVRTTYTMAPGEYCESTVEYGDPTAKIKHVTMGNIDMFSDVEPDEVYYTDYSAEEGGSTTLRAGETLTLSAECVEDDYLIGVWIDWNNDGSFYGKGEEMGYIYGNTLEIKIPEGINVTEGMKRMRLVLDVYGEPVPCGSYYFGETEDYGIRIAPNAVDPYISTDLKEISEYAQEETKQAAITVTNSGNGVLEADVRVTYQLPEVYEERALAPAAAFKDVLKVRKDETPGVVAAPAQRLQIGEEIAHVLHYDGGYADAVSLGNFDSAIFANYFPREKMAALKGMTISSIDVYINDVPAGASVKVFGQGVDRAHSGEILGEKAFTAQPKCWNRVTFDTPVEITGEDIWFGVEMTGMTDTEYYIGIDGIPAVPGYGDVCNVGGETWWSMSELGIDHNYCVRANVTGERSAYLGWLTIDKETLTLEAAAGEDLTATLDPAGLADGIYEAAIVINSNDGLQPDYTIPVYLAHNILTSIDASTLEASNIKVTNDGIVITSQEIINNYQIVDIAGRITAGAPVMSDSAVIPFTDFNSGVYLLTVTYANGKNETVKFAMAR